jgi:hypothetical protein
MAKFASYLSSAQRTGNNLQRQIGTTQQRRSSGARGKMVCTAGASDTLLLRHGAAVRFIAQLKDPHESNEGSEGEVALQSEQTES